jgi:hypothetical protein
MKKCGFCSGCGSFINALCNCGGGGCGGCSGEVYWSEWHNDPPYCHDPCNNHGDWIGPHCGPGGGWESSGGYNGPYGYQGGYMGAQSRPTNNGAAYAQQNAASRTQAANNSCPPHPTNYASAANANQSPRQPVQTRTAWRPTANRAAASKTNGAPTQPILW